MQALDDGADVVVTGRVADAALFAGPLFHAHRWARDDWEHLVSACSLVGHLLECAGQATGGYFADPGVNDVPGLADLGFPFADVGADGRVEIAKVAGTGGVNVRTCTEQLLYEVHDPARYVTPDAVVDFSRVGFTEVGESRVAVHGVDAGPPPATRRSPSGAWPASSARARSRTPVRVASAVPISRWRSSRSVCATPVSTWCSSASTGSASMRPAAGPTHPSRTTSPRCASVSPAGCAPKPTPSGFGARSPGCGSTARPVAAGHGAG